MATRLKVEYTDGRVVEILASPRAQVDTERQYAGMNDEARIVEVGYYLAWRSLNFAGQESADYEQWLNTIADVEEIAKVEPRPTAETQSTTPSSD